MTESLRTYFRDRKTYKDFLRRQKAAERGELPREGTRDHFTTVSAYDRFRRIYEAARGTVKFHGIPLVIEIAAGENHPESNEPRKSPAPNAYGSIQNTIGKDTETLDFFLGPDLGSGTVAIINQLKPDGAFDEHKVLVGFQLDSAEAARAAYLANYEDGWKGFGGAKLLSLGEFKEWLETYDPTKPVVAEKALAEGSGPTGGYVCPSCGGRMWCECSGRKAHGPDNSHEPATGGDANAVRDSGDSPEREVSPSGEPFPESEPGPQPEASLWKTDSIDFDQTLRGAA